MVAGTGKTLIRYPTHNCVYSESIESLSRRKGGASRWRKSKTRRSPSSPQIPQKYIYMWNNSCRTPTERWQKTSDLPKGKKLPMYLGRAKEKTETKNRDGACSSGREP